MARNIKQLPSADISMDKLLPKIAINVQKILERDYDWAVNVGEGMKMCNNQCVQNDQIGDDWIKCPVCGDDLSISSNEELLCALRQTLQQFKLKIIKSK